LRDALVLGLVGAGLVTGATAALVAVRQIAVLGIRRGRAAHASDVGSS
jgi:hypothetical protein